MPPRGFLVWGRRGVCRGYAKSTPPHGGSWLPPLFLRISKRVADPAHRVVKYDKCGAPYPHISPSSAGRTPIVGAAALRNVSPTNRAFIRAPGAPKIAPRHGADMRQLRARVIRLSFGILPSAPALVEERCGRRPMLFEVVAPL